MKINLILTAMFSAMYMAQGVSDDAKSFVVGYLPHYRIEDATSQQFAGVSDVVYFGLKLSADGKIDHEEVDQAALNRLGEIREANQCRILISVGGWGRSNGFAQLTKTQASRLTFISSLLSICVDRKFDGVDFDWEHPEGKAELTAYSGLLLETKAELEPLPKCAMAKDRATVEATAQNFKSVHRIHSS